LIGGRTMEDREADLFFEGQLVFIHTAPSPEISIAEDNQIEIGMPGYYFSGLQDGDRIDGLGAGRVVEKLLEVKL
jgi:hypothetical protein